jgi:DNA-directed RNA polymerase subunit RPC12/RpoP
MMVFDVKQLNTYISILNLEMPKLGMKILNIIVFIILCTLGVLFLLAAPVDPIRMQSRIIIGSILLVVSLISLVSISLLIHRSEQLGPSSTGEIPQTPEKLYVPKELVCPECGELIKITDDLKQKTYVYCDQCGKEILIPKDSVNWG